MKVSARPRVLLKRSSSVPKVLECVYLSGEEKLPRTSTTKRRPPRASISEASPAKPPHEHFRSQRAQRTRTPNNEISYDTKANATGEVNAPALRV